MIQPVTIETPPSQLGAAYIVKWPKVGGWANKKLIQMVASRLPAPAHRSAATVRHNYALALNVHSSSSL